MSVPKITIEAELSRSGLLELRAAIDALLAGVAAEPEREPESPAPPEIGRRQQAQAKAEAVLTRIGDNPRRLLRTAAHAWEDEEEFTLGEIAVALGETPQTVRSWNRNLGRTLKQVDGLYPAPELLVKRWDGEQNRYRLLPEVRAALRELLL